MQARKESRPVLFLGTKVYSDMVCGGIRPPCLSRYYEQSGEQSIRVIVLRAFSGEPYIGPGVPVTPENGWLCSIVDQNP